MTLQAIQNGFVAGEISPSLWGRTDLAKYHQGAFTMRNFFCNYRGGAASRAGLAYVGMCKQPGTAAPPRDIPFQFSNSQGYQLEFGDQYMRVKSRGAYVTEAPEAVSAVSASGPGITIVAHGYSVGDWLFFAGLGGMTALNGLTWIVVAVPDANTVRVSSLFGDAFTTAGQPAYTSGGTAARLYTLVTPYAAVDVPYLKFTQSADTMTLCCVNFATLTEYPPYELERLGATNWTLNQDSFATNIAAPTGVASTASSSTTLSTYYSYVVTAVDARTGQESVASAPSTVHNNDIAINAGSNTTNWNPVPGAGSYNIYKATPAYSVGVPIGSLFGYAGSALGTSFTDSNITADFTTVPPVHENPFARGAITAATVTAGGTGYSQGTVGFTITSTSGSGFIGEAIVVGSAVVAFLIQNGGQGYVSGDTITITGGTGATATLSIGPQSGTYPSTVAYYQQRRVYASSLNNPDTYWMSQTGAFSNMDSSIPVTDADAIVGTPWAQQVNGVQFLVPMPGGLVILTGKGAWQLNGGNNSALTPSDQDASPQAYNGCSNIVPPITVNYDILYLQTKGSIFRDLSYNYFVNIYTGTDLTVLSNHLFAGRTFSQWCWAEEPYKLAWALRDDGALLSLTYLKEQDVYAWSRHDTNGLFVGVSAITEPPVDAVYAIVKRYVRGQWVYYSERMDDRDWTSAEDSWCVDAGLSYVGQEPAAVLSASSATGTSNITSVTLLSGGSGYVSPTIILSDPGGLGSGASFEIVMAVDVITSILVLTEGAGYAPGTTMVIQDLAGTGALGQPVLTNNATFTSSGPVFASTSLGSVIRMGGGQATIVGYVDQQHVTANITQPILDTIPNDPNNQPAPAAAGTWSLSAPVTSVSGLNHLEGLTVAVVTDGSVAPQQVVTNGTITLAQPATRVLVGLPFTAQLQTSYLDPPNQPVTMQGKRKNIYSVSVRVEATRGLQVGTNQVDASVLPKSTAVSWSAGMKELKERRASVAAGQPLSLFTGDEFINLPASWNVAGQVAMQQVNPLPANVLGVVAYYQVGDTPG